MANIILLNESDSRILCVQAESILHDITFKLVLIFEILLSIPAIFFNIILMLSIFRLIVYHSNLRCLLFHHSTNLTMLSFATMFRSLYILLVGYTMARPCSLITNLYNCKLLELLAIVPLVNTISSLICICLERLYATFGHSTYDTGSKMAWLACILIPLVWLMSLVYYLHPLPLIPKNRSLPICANLLAMTPKTATISMGQSLTMEAIALCLVLALYFINILKLKETFINRARHSLASRFQISQNIEVNSFLIPSLLAHAACFIPVIIYLILIIHGLQLSLNTKMILIHVQYLWILIYVIIHPIVVLGKSAQLKKVWRSYTPEWVMKLFQWDKKEHKRAISEADMHFKALEDMWTKKP